ncbi:hypothetical protein H0Z60_09485 [Ectothiorhodospiraceae bacterium WFHF3C12]|nr:hypothetical protein [Ectothiorhodospiraceae bacterium WFHF3C12]
MAVFAASRKSPVARAVDNGRETMNDNVERISRGSRKALRQSRRYARRHPLMTAGIVTGAAVAATTAGYAWYRRRNGR